MWIRSKVTKPYHNKWHQAESIMTMLSCKIPTTFTKEYEQSFEIQRIPPALSYFNMICINVVSTEICQPLTTNSCFVSYSLSVFLQDIWVIFYWNGWSKFRTWITDIAQGSWWRHQMETFSALPAFCTGNSPANGEFRAQRPVTRSFGVFFDLRPNKRLSEQSWGWWFWDAIAPIITSL